MSFNFGTYNPSGNQPYQNYTGMLGYGQPSYGFGMQNAFNWNQQQYASVVQNPGVATGSPMPYQQTMNWGDNAAYKNYSHSQPSGQPFPSQGGDFSSMGMGGRPFPGMPQVAPSAPSAQAFYGGGVKLLSVTPIPGARGCGISCMPPQMGGKFY